MTSDDPSFAARLEKLIRESSERTSHEIADVRGSVQRIADRIMIHDQQISRLESGQTRSMNARADLRTEVKADIQDLHAANTEQTKLLQAQREAFLQAEATRAGMASMLRWLVIFGVAILGGLVWLIQHAR
jgi:chromosome segregation ATPase